MKIAIFVAITEKLRHMIDGFFHVMENLTLFNIKIFIVLSKHEQTDLNNG